MRDGGEKTYFRYATNSVDIACPDAVVTLKDVDESLMTLIDTNSNEVSSKG